AGAKTPACTSQHVHVGVEDFTAAQIANFARIWYKQEKLILKAVGTLPSRLAHYTKPTDREFIDRLEQMKPQTRQQLNIAWYGYANPRPAHYDSTRYRAINLNNVWTTGTVELRCYENNDVMGTRRFFKHKSLKTSSHYFHRKPCRIGVWQNFRFLFSNATGLQIFKEA
ncbi:MAG: amidoligase family protein, partial [Victivallales bacterium]|nr:amidoligase family protein [Victivallales bacterium]